MKRTGLALLMACAIQSACLYRCGDRYACTDVSDCAFLDACIDGQCVPVGGEPVDGGRTSSGGNGRSSSSTTGGNTSSSGGNTSSATSLAPLEACQPLAGCEDGGCPHAEEVVMRTGGNCARFRDGTVQCWGHNEASMLGRGTAGGDQRQPSPMVNADGGVLRDVVGVARGTQFTCAVLDGGRMACAGSLFTSAFGQLEQGDAGSRSEVRNAVLTTATGVRNASAGHVYSCHDGDGGTTCHGVSTYGRLGEQLPSDVTALSLGPDYALALTPQGTVMAWGNNDDGVLGTLVSSQGGMFYRAAAAAVPDVASATRISAGDHHACAVLTDGTIKCWGRNGLALGREDGGVLQQGQQTPSTVRTWQDVDFDNATDVAASDSHTCAVQAEGSLWCWGANSYGPLGEGANTLGERHPRRATALGSWARVAASGNTTCAVNTCGQVFCWGRNTFQQLGPLGPGTENGTPIPVRVPFPTP